MSALKKKGLIASRRRKEGGGGDERKIAANSKKSWGEGREISFARRNVRLEGKRKLLGDCRY